MPSNVPPYIRARRDAHSYSYVQLRACHTEIVCVLLLLDQVLFVICCVTVRLCVVCIVTVCSCVQCVCQSGVECSVRVYFCLGRTQCDTAFWIVLLRIVLRDLF